MLELINRYAHGFVAIPVILACREQGLFELLREPNTTRGLARRLRANEGHLQLALRLLHSLRSEAFGKISSRFSPRQFG